MTTTAVTTKPRPFLKWAGGKSQILDQIGPYFPCEDIHTYYEPFLGGGAMFFKYSAFGEATGIMPFKHAVLSDINPELINAYVQVRDNPHALMEKLGLFYNHFCQEGGDFYNDLAAGEGEYHEYVGDWGYGPPVEADGWQGVDYKDPISNAARFIFLNKTCFNGLWRENAAGKFNVPCGVKPDSLKLSRIYDRDNILACSRALQEVELRCQDYSDIISNYWRCGQSALAGHLQRNDFVYLDPPYWPRSGTSNFTSYSKHPFGAAEQVELFWFTELLNGRGIEWALSNSDTPFIRALYDHAPHKLHTIDARRSINSVGSKRGPVQELLILPR